MNETSSLQYILLCQQVTAQIETQIGIKNKELAEYLIDLALESKSETEFKYKLLEDAEFSDDFISSLYKLIKSKSSQQSKQQISQQNQTLKTNYEEKKFINKTDNNNNNINEEQDHQEELENSSPKKKKPKEKKKKRSISSSLSQKKKKKTKKYHRSRSRSYSPKKSHKISQVSKSPKKPPQPIEKGQIFDGIVTKISDFGCFVQLQNTKYRTEGLVHISQIANKRINNPSEIVKIGQTVKVKILSNISNKISLSMKEVDQLLGHEKSIFPLKNNSHLQQQHDILLQKEEKKFGPLDPKEILKINEKSEYGTLTGIRLSIKEKENSKKKKVQDSPDLWESSRLQYTKHLDLPQQEIDLEAELSDENDVEIEMNEREAPFLKDTTTKGGVNLSPVRVVKNQEGSLQREALNAIQQAKERKEMRIQQNNAIMDSVNKQELLKMNIDPTADTRILMSQLKTLGQMQNSEIPEYKKEAMFKVALNQSGKTKQTLTIREQQQSLPIYQYKHQLIKACQENQILIVIGETGSGKTTQMTQYLLEAGFCKSGKKIGCTQPRRVAATSVAKRVAEEMGVVLGEEVGYSIRFEDCTSSSTVIKYMTDGMLLREALLDPDMTAYSCIMLDEAHERQLSTDVLFGLLKKVVKKRKDFTLIVTSATLDAEKFSSYFFDCRIFRVPGRTYKVEVLYSTEPESDYVDASLIVIMQIHLHEPSGDILLFLTGQEEIDNACQILFERMKKLGTEAPELIILPVYSALPQELQNRIFLPTPQGTRKCIIATNIAEASLTIDGIYYVVDPGFAKVKVYNPKLGMDSLIIAPISQASARQRAGRAGRTGPGKCFRLYTEEAFKNEMLPTSVPEIQRTNLANTVLLLKAMGINDLLNFDFMDPPAVQTLIQAMEQLFYLGCLDDEGLLTRLGLKMAEFPLEPPMSKMLITSVDLACSDEIATIIAMLSVQNVFFSPKDKKQQADQRRAKFYHVEGDHLTLLTVYEAWKANNFSNIWCHENFIDARTIRRAQDIRKQLIGIMERYHLPIQSCGKNYAKIRKAICSGFFNHAAKKDRVEGYKTIMDNHTVFIHPTSALFQKSPEWVVYHELVLTSKEYMRNITKIDPKWLVDVAPSFFQYASAGNLSKIKKQEKLESLSNKYGDPEAWRLSKRRGNG
ncbi:hypothetical protein IMG5_140980 [Ichthyophthirius multifiliis]|uniref:RNA helicase n=1 Tax=Ichthyophthirius multifiliis TaxID=5932 RepID=G0QXC3_ICHMU|nr:hypothetical protein IMG5_140980 [Ichthyophthirius multifiliis]EGR30133.1 hypothetical protein IMG5_140980 [Ichthyophthirius multifiliis]|eukprot:XP_004031369.1 hypothetical protein IMG5_140980 [Ichthyophthirius multifiliis]